MNDARTVFADTVEIVQWLQDDRETPYAERLSRDRAIAADLPPAEPLEKVRAWWQRIREQVRLEPQLVTNARRVERATRLITLLITIIGLSAGAAVAGAVLHYDGTWPVNVVTVLATLVFVQILLIALSVLLMLPRVPGLAAIQDLLTDINPAALTASIYERLRPGPADRNLAFHFQDARGPVAARLARWHILVWSQLAAVAFNTAAAATLAALVTFTDLAFGWSTTLQLDSSEALRITNAISAPWRVFWQDAVPSATLIEQSRFFRLADARHVIASASTLAGWWPFVLASILFYALIPRLALLAFAALRLRAATRNFLLDDPQVRALLDRMSRKRVELGVAESEDNLAPIERLQPRPAPSPTMSASAIVWSGALPSGAVEGWVSAHLAWRVSEVSEAGGASSLTDDSATIEKLMRVKPGAVLILVRAWEAPLLDLRDFLTQLRSRIGASSTMLIVPVGPDGVPADDAQRATWSRWTAAIADPALYMESGT